MAAEQPIATSRAATGADLDAILDLDHSLTGRTRRRFYQARLAATEHEPMDFVSLVIEAEGRIFGFAFAHVLSGEFGGTERVAVVDAIGVRPEARGHALGKQLMDAVERQLLACGVREIQTQAAWTDIDMVRFLASAGFALAPKFVLERDTTATL
jgi:GNAT superfamily N-acetyltransferase